MKILQSTVLLPALAIGVVGWATSSQAQLTTNDPSLPPVGGTYRTPEEVHATFSGPGLALILSQIQHSGFSNVIRFPQGPDEREEFDSTLTGLISVNGSPDQPATGGGPVQTVVRNKIGNVTGTFQTEMLSMNLTGNSPFGPFMIRESPTLQSTGQTSITDIGGGMFQIDSFFDVFTELSIDGGATWMPDTSGPAHVNLIPEPTSMSLLAAGFVGLVGCVRRRRVAA